MQCGICNNELEKCTCPDIDERMANLRNDPYFIYKMCRTCGKHYARCKCEKPDWTTSHDSKELSDVDL